jgi:ABC-type sulfate/molybdate transport systems ATPase subunit
VAQDRITITIDPDVLDELRAQVPTGEISAYVVEALRRRLRRDPVMAMLDELDERFGPTDAESRKEAEQWLAQITKDWPT